MANRNSDGQSMDTAFITFGTWVMAIVKKCKTNLKKSLNYSLKSNKTLFKFKHCNKIKIQRTEN